MTRSWAVAVVGVCFWCLIVMAMGVSNAHSVWEWIWTFAFGAVAPVILLRLVADVVTKNQRARSDPAHDLRLLGALHDGGELSAAAIAVRTSLALEDVVTRLDAMAARGHIDVRLADDGELYALPGRVAVR